MFGFGVIVLVTPGEEVVSLSEQVVLSRGSLGWVLYLDRCVGDRMNREAAALLDMYYTYRTDVACHCGIADGHGFTSWYSLLRVELPAEPNQHQVPCPTCNGTGLTPFRISSHKERCPVCDGRATQEAWSFDLAAVPVPYLLESMASGYFKERNRLPWVRGDYVLTPAGGFLRGEIETYSHCWACFFQATM